MVIGVSAMLAITGCSQGASDATAPSSSAPSASAPVLDCAAARLAMDDYSVALTDLATSIEAGDAMSAVAAADAISYSLDQLQASLPEMPAEGDAFVTASRAVALKVKESAAASPQMTGLLAELTSAFADPAFAQSGEAIDAYVGQACPEASSDPRSDPSPSAS
ncbi:MAG: hypothetical protein RL134_1952 [Actinomycetota bacterium]